MEAGVAVFTEKGYDAATMSEIAARSGTAIGSLYRFFKIIDATIRETRSASARRMVTRAFVYN